MQQIKSVGVMSAAKVFGVLHACLALILTPLFLFAGLGTIFVKEDKRAILGGLGITILAILAPLIFGMLGFVKGAFMAWIYNLIAKKFGGIKVQLQPVQPISNPSLT